MRVAIHQPNLIPWLPFFYKMAMVDKFIILENVQFEKGGFQNRYKTSAGSWVTKSVCHGLEPLSSKQYSDMTPLVKLNMQWINVIKNTLDIHTEIVFDSPLKFECATEKLIFETHAIGGNIYITNPDAKLKYLKEDKMRSAGIEIEYCKVPKHLQIHVFEAFEKWGIDGTIKQLESAKCKILDSSSIT